MERRGGAMAALAGGDGCVWASTGGGELGDFARSRSELSLTRRRRSLVRIANQLIAPGGAGGGGTGAPFSGRAGAGAGRWRTGARRVACQVPVQTLQQRACEGNTGRRRGAAAGASCRGALGTSTSTVPGVQCPLSTVHCPPSTVQRARAVARLLNAFSYRLLFPMAGPQRPSSYPKDRVSCPLPARPACAAWNP